MPPRDLVRGSGPSGDDLPEPRTSGTPSTLRALRKQPGTAERDYEIGYARPPVYTRFQPGQSGNPHGRPTGARNRKRRLPALNEERLKTVVIEEAYRLISVRDGDRLVEIPVVQAIMRAVAVNAAKGDRRSQQMFAQLLQWVERENKALHDEWLQTAIDYKHNWTEEIERCRRLGVAVPDPLPHPDDIVINMQNGQVEIRGPMTKEDKLTYDRLREFWQDGRDIIARIERELAERPRDKSLKKTLESLRRTQAKVESVLPRRWQVMVPGPAE